MQSLSDNLLITELKAGSEQAFTELFNRHKPMVYMEAYYQLKDEEEAKDIVQDIFIWLWEKKHEITNGDFLKQYLFKATRNKCIDKHRKSKTVQKFRQNYPHIKESSTKEIPLETKELGLQLTNAINAIPAPASKKAFEMLYLEGKSQKNIAQEMDIQIQTVKNQVSRALKIIRGNLKKD